MLDVITWDVSPYIFGDSGVRWYGLLWAIGLYVCWKINESMYKKENCPAEWPDLLFFWMAAGVIIVWVTVGSTSGMTAPTRLWQGTAV